MLAMHVIRRPLLSEKANSQMESGRYTFEVDARATKTQIKAAIKELYKVDAVKINTALHETRLRPSRFGMIGGDVSKKATVRLKDGQSIELF
ncbi:MAG: uL23 family ribosomal protein [Phycisphaerales bacterium]